MVAVTRSLGVTTALRQCGHWRVRVALGEGPESDGAGWVSMGIKSSLDFHGPEFA
jgi:hypothetical protein